MEESNSFSPSKLNDAFGFATILACLDSAKHLLAHPLMVIWTNRFPAAFLIYFFVFRSKMYIDDARHVFSHEKPVDMWIAVASWIAFIVSGASIEDNADVAIGWFILGLTLSSIWIVVAFSRPRWRRHAVFAVANAAQLAILVYSACFDSALSLVLATALVLIEAACHRWIVSSGVQLTDLSIAFEFVQITETLEVAEEGVDGSVKS